MRGDIVHAPDGTEITLVDVGTTKVLDDDTVRIFDVVLPAGGHHPWHLHDNPYVVLSVAGSSGRMDWLDGSPSRNISEYTGGSVVRPVSTIHCLTNTGGTPYRNRLIELKDLGEKRADGPLMIPDARSVEGESAGPDEADGRTPVILHDLVRVWLVTVPAGGSVDLELDDVTHVLAELDADLEGDELMQVARTVPGGRTTLANDQDRDRTWHVVALDYLDRLPL